MVVIIEKERIGWQKQTQCDGKHHVWAYSVHPLKVMDDIDKTDQHLSVSSVANNFLMPELNLVQV
jgi:hypothetical protein